MIVFNRESCAIILYLIEHYDKEHKISVSSPRANCGAGRGMAVGAVVG